MANDPAKILIADDNPHNLVALDAILESLGHEIVRADSGEAALEFLAQQQFAVIILDVRMPTLSGPDTAKRVREGGLNRETPIIFVTAVDDPPEEILHAYASGAIDYLTKPIHPEVLRWKVAGFIALFERTRELERQLKRVRELEHREEVRKRSDERFRLLADSAPVMVWISDTARRCIWFNKSWLEFVGQSLEHEIGSGWTDGLHPDDVQRCLRTYSDSFDARTPFTMECRLKRHDGAYRWILDTGRPFYGDDETFLGYIGSCIDIHDRKIAESERESLLQSEKQAKEAAEAANRLKDEFLANVSHELRTPLNAMLGWATLLRMPSRTPDELDSGLEVIERNARIQARIIEDLLDVARIMSGKLRLDVQLVSLPDVIEAAVAAITPAAEAKQVRLQKVLDSGAGPVSGDPARLQQIVWNLLSNAVKFTPKDGKVQVRLERVNSHVEISVTDTGEGIEPDFLPYVFDRFRQNDASSTRRHGGLGLGLSIVRQLVELHGGTVRVKSPGRNQGSTFIVALPLPVIHQPAVDGDRVHPRIDEAVDSHCDDNILDGVRVLVVDDEPDARQLVKHLLEECEATVELASSVEEALRILKRFRPHVLISDIGMPGQDGYDLMREVRQTFESRDMPAIALTAFARTEDRRRALQAGFQMHVAKPVDPTELTAAVASLAGLVKGEK